MVGVVLVHGLWHIPEHFRTVAEGLRAKGIEVAVPMLHRGSLAADTESVQTAVDAMAEPPVVLGHSYGGSVITGLSRVAHLVYLAAYVPGPGDSAARLGSTAVVARAIRRQEADATTYIDPDQAVEAFYGDCSAELAAWAVARLRRQSRGCGSGVPQHYAWRNTPSTYVVCSLDRAIAPDLQYAMARRCGAVRTWGTSHSAFLSRPDLVIELVTEVLGSLHSDCDT